MSFAFGFSGDDIEGDEELAKQASGQDLGLEVGSKPLLSPQQHSLEELVSLANNMYIARRLFESRVQTVIRSL